MTRDEKKGPERSALEDNETWPGAVALRMKGRANYAS